MIQLNHQLQIQPPPLEVPYSNERRSCERVMCSTPPMVQNILQRMTSFAGGVPIVLHYFSLQRSLTDCFSGPVTRMAQTVAVTGTKNMIDHLHAIHRIDKNGLMDSKEAITQRIDHAFGKTQQRIDFNIDMFKQHLLRWIILNHITFRQVEDNAFRYLLFYLLACASSSCTHYCVGEAVPLIVTNPSQLSDRRPHFP